MILPFKTCKITKLYGTKPPAGVSYKLGHHTGIDLVGIGDKTVLACEAGKVISVGYDKAGWGNYIKIQGKSGLYSIYCHLSAVKVKTGDILASGAPIGAEGATGQVTGSHLHLEFRSDHRDAKSALDPCEVLKIVKKIGEVELMPTFTTGEEALEYLISKGMINSPGYWRSALNCVKYLDKLFIKWAESL